METNLNIESTVKKHLSIITVMTRRSHPIPHEMSTGLIFANFEHLWADSFFPHIVVCHVLCRLILEHVIDVHFYMHIHTRISNDEEEERIAWAKEIVSAIGTTPYNHVRFLLEEINTHSINEQTSTIIILIIHKRKGYGGKDIACSSILKKWVSTQPWSKQYVILS